MESDVSRRKDCLESTLPNTCYKIVAILVSSFSEHFKILEKIRNTSPTAEKSREQLKTFTLKWSSHSLKDHNQTETCKSTKSKVCIHHKADNATPLKTQNLGLLQ